MRASVREREREREGTVRASKREQEEEQQMMYENFESLCGFYFLYEVLCWLR